MKWILFLTIIVGSHGSNPVTMSTQTVELRSRADCVRLGKRMAATANAARPNYLVTARFTCTEVL